MSEGEKGENKTGAKFSLYTVTVLKLNIFQNLQMHLILMFWLSMMTQILFSIKYMTLLFRYLINMQKSK